MSRGFPSMTALLGLLAVAGYQNRDKIAEMLADAAKARPNAPGKAASAASSASWARASAVSLAGGILSGGLGELVDRFTQSGQGRNRGVLGRRRALTSRSRRLSSSRRSAPRRWKPCRNKQDCRAKSCSQDCPASSPTRSIDTRRTAGYRLKPSFRVPRRLGPDRFPTRIAAAADPSIGRGWLTAKETGGGGRQSIPKSPR